MYCPTKSFFYKARSKKLFIVFFSLSLIISCGYQEPYYTPKLSSLELDQIAKKFKHENDKAVIYIFNKSTNYSVRVPIVINGTEICNLVGPTYVKFEVMPGVREIISKTENHNSWKIGTYSTNIISSPENDSRLLLRVEANEIYYLQLVPTWKKQISFQLQEVSEKQSKKSILRRRLVETKIP